MDSSTFSLLLGIASSLIATLLFIAISETIRRVLIPWYADMIYRGVRVDGDWTIEHEQNEEEKDVSQSLVLKQSGDKVSGEMLVIVGKSKHMFKFTGRIENMYLSGVAYPTSQRLIDPQTFLFHIDYLRGKLRMKGAICGVREAGDIWASSGITASLNNS